MSSTSIATLLTPPPGVYTSQSTHTHHTHTHTHTHSLPPTIMCEVLPTLDETSPSPDGENSKLELLMMSMLEERDKLMEKLRENQESYNEATRRLSEVQADNSVLMRQLQALMPEVRV